MQGEYKENIWRIYGECKENTGEYKENTKRIYGECKENTRRI